MVLSLFASSEDYIMWSIPLLQWNYLCEHHCSYHFVEVQTFSEDSALTVAMVLVNLKTTDAKHTLAVLCHVMLNLPDMPVSLVCENLVNKTVLLIHVVFMMRFICTSKMSVIFILFLSVKSLLYYIQLELCVLTLNPSNVPCSNSWSRVYIYPVTFMWLW